AEAAEAAAARRAALLAAGLPADSALGGAFGAQLPASSASGGIDPDSVVPNAPLKIGDKVRVKGSDVTGEVKQISGKNISVAVGSIISIVKTDRIERISNNEFRENHRASSSTGAASKGNFDKYAMAERRMNVRPEIDIRGQRLDEALVSVQRFMDDAFMIGINQVRILHGKGTGVLREEVRKYVRSLPGVLKVEDESFENGGAGITIVYLQ
ncbi:MAG: Smr/MutS family protein, partial [Bacteroidales bacterium]